MVEQVQPTIADVIAVAEFRSALRHFLRRSEKIARQSGLTPQRYTLLMMIKGAPGGSEQSTVTELAERMQLAQSTVTELVRRAESAGLIEREQSQRDARVAHLRLTPEGERRLMLSFTELGKERAQLREALQRRHAGRLRNRRGRDTRRDCAARSRSVPSRAKARAPRRALAARQRRGDEHARDLAASQPGGARPPRRDRRGRAGRRRARARPAASPVRARRRRARAVQCD